LRLRKKIIKKNKKVTGGIIKKIFLLNVNLINGKEKVLFQIVLYLFWLMYEV